MLEIGSRSDVVVQTDYFQPILSGSGKAIGDLRMPDAEFCLLAAGIGLLAVTVSEAGIYPQRYSGARHALAELINHIQ